MASKSRHGDAEQAAYDELSAEQKRAVVLAVAGRSFFLTGGAGVGKTKTILAIFEALRRARRHFAVTSTTGITAVAINGQTLHSWAGFGIPNDLKDAQLRASRNKRIAIRWRKTQVLIVDEVSMLGPNYFMILDQMGRRLRGKPHLPFGGIQLIFVGDFFQLPPVPDKPPPEPAVKRAKIEELGDDGLPLPKPEPPRFVFQLPLWKECFSTNVLLTVSYRQKEDREFAELLNRAREGRMVPEDVDLLNTRVMPEWKAMQPTASGIIPTILFAHKASVAEINLQKLNELGNELRTFEVQTRTTTIDHETGSAGPVKVEESSDSDTDEDDKSESEDEQVFDEPSGERSAALEAMLADLVKQQPALPEVKLCAGAQVMLRYSHDPERGLMNGSRGVVLGFAKNLMQAEAELADPEDPDLQFVYDETKETEEDDGKEWPVVRYLNGDIVLHRMHAWTKRRRGVGTAIYEQVGVEPAWAVTIHKGQGMSTDCATLRLTRRIIFEVGQAYVALSRARSLAGLRLIEFEPGAVRADHRVVEFYRNMRGGG